MPKSLRIAAVCLAAASWLAAGEVAEEIGLHPPRGASVRLSVWSMEHQVREGDLLLNADQAAKPWAGLVFKPAKAGQPILTVTDDWAAKGCLRFRINGLDDAYGQATAPCGFQVQLGGCMARYLHVPERFYAGGRGVDSDAATWQDVLVPFRFLGVKPGGKVASVSIQCVDRPQSAFTVRDVSLLRPGQPLDRDAERVAMAVAQPQVTWPTLDDLPDSLKPERNAPLLRDGRFITADGRRAFLLMPWSREDQRLNLGINAEGTVCPDFGLYDKAAHRFIYERPLDGESMARLGFNCYASQVDPRPFWQAVGYQARHGEGFTHAMFLDHVRRMQYPFYVDMVCFPWTLGRPAQDKGATLPEGVLHNGDRHWTPYRIVGKGRETWLTMWRTYAQRYKDAGARVLFYELMNEPAYAATTPDHRDEFVAWLKGRYTTLDRVNAIWGTAYASWDAVRSFKSIKDCTGIFFDYDEYLADRFADLIRAGRDAIEAITPGVPAAVQTMGGYTLLPRDAIHLSKLIPIERAVLAPTGGGRWTKGFANARPKAHTMDYGIGPSPLANDLLRAMAGDKMIVDNELYLGDGQTRAAMRDRLWKAVIAGLDGAAWFSWSKRGWAWWQGRDNVLREADLFPYSNLIPFARRPDAIRGVLDFAQEMELVREYILPKPWGPPATVGMLYSWANARWAAWEPSWRDRTGNTHAAMRHLHWNFDMVPSHLAAPERLSRYDLLVAGSVDRVEPELLERLAAFVRGGGKLLVVDSLMAQDLYGKPVDAAPLLGLRVSGRVPVGAGGFRVVGLPELLWLPGAVDRGAARLDVEPLDATEVLWRDAEGRAVVTRHPLGKGAVVFVAADLRGYRLAKLLAALRPLITAPPAMQVLDARTGELAPNVLVSRRSHASHHALLLLNTDPFPKLVRIRLRGLDGVWHACDPLDGRRFPSPAGAAAWPAREIAEPGVPYLLGGGARGLLLLTREPWAKTPLTPCDAKALGGAFDAAMQAWHSAQPAPR